MLVAEACIAYAERGMTLSDALDEIYENLRLLQRKCQELYARGQGGHGADRRRDGEACARTRRCRFADTAVAASEGLSSAQMRAGGWYGLRNDAANVGRAALAARGRELDRHPPPAARSRSSSSTSARGLRRKEQLDQKLAALLNDVDALLKGYLGVTKSKKHSRKQQRAHRYRCALCCVAFLLTIVVPD